MKNTIDALTAGIKFGLPIALRGRPGIGKTSMVEVAAQRLGLDLEVVIGSLREPSDFAGLPIVTSSGDVKLAPPSWAVRATQSRNGCVVLLDELTTASPAVQAAMLRVVRERVVGDLQLPDSVRIVAAYNDARDCGGYELELPMRSRLIHLNVTADLEVFIEGILSDWQVAPNSEVMTRPIDRQYWNRLVAGFLRVRPSFLETSPPEGSTGGYPCPRSWSLLIDSCAAAQSCGMPDEVITMMASGAVGPGVASEFLVWVDQLDLPDPRAILRDPKSVVSYLSTTRPDRAIVILYALCDVVAHSGDPQLWTRSWKVLAQFVDAGFGDLVVWSSRKLLRARPDKAVLPEEFAIIQQYLDPS